MDAKTNRLKRKPVAVRNQSEATLVRHGWKLEDLAANARATNRRLRALERAKARVQASARAKLVKADDTNEAEEAFRKAHIAKPEGYFLTLDSGETVHLPWLFVAYVARTFNESDPGVKVEDAPSFVVAFIGSDGEQCCSAYAAVDDRIYFASVPHGAFWLWRDSIARGNRARNQYRWGTKYKRHPDAQENWPEAYIDQEDGTQVFILGGKRHDG